MNADITVTSAVMIHVHMDSSDTNNESIPHPVRTKDRTNNISKSFLILFFTLLFLLSQVLLYR